MLLPCSASVSKDGVKKGFYWGNTAHFLWTVWTVPGKEAVAHHTKTDQLGGDYHSPLTSYLSHCSEEDFATQYLA